LGAGQCDGEGWEGEAFNKFTQLLSSANNNIVDELGNSELSEAGLPYALDEEFMTRISEATSISIKPAWIKPNGMVLNAARFQQWGETPEGAMGPVDWKWDGEGPPKDSVTENHKSAMMNAAQLGKQLDDAEASGMVEWYDPARFERTIRVQHPSPWGKSKAKRVHQNAGGPYPPGRKRTHDPTTLPATHR
jgi:hypothetical protein